jgi:predicted enzyme related to lactoylglutathione lyase
MVVRTGDFIGEACMSQNTFCWVDVPVTNLDRAIRFYSAVLGGEVKKESFGEMNFGLLPHYESNVSGCLVAGKEFLPSQSGPMVYFSVEGRLDDAIAQVNLNGGKILQKKCQIGPHGYRAIILDSEGNRVALHSVKE